jgi:hypothetical protein
MLQSRAGKELTRIRHKPTRPPEERFWEKVDKDTGPVHPALGRCWVWTGGTFRFGYGAFSLNRLTTKAHRFSWKLHNGPLADDVLVRHLCNNPPCVNPAHLAPGDFADNTADMMQAGRCSVVTIPYATVLAVRERYRPGVVGYKTIAREFGLHPVIVKRFIKRERRRHVEPMEATGGV